MKRSVLLFSLLSIGVSACWFVRKAPTPTPAVVVDQASDAGLIELPETVPLPAAFEWQHAGTLEDLRPFAHLMPQGTELTDFTFVGRSCHVQVTLGKPVRSSGDCPPLTVSADGGEKAWVAALKPRLFHRDLKAGIWPVDGWSEEGWVANAEDLAGLRALLAIPQAGGDVEIQSLRVVAGKQGDWLALELKVKEAPIAAFSRWQLTMRYGKNPNYGRDVLSWGDGQRLLWALRLNNGGFGMEMMPQRIRLVLISGKEWEPRLSELLKELPKTRGLVPVPGYDGLSAELADNGLRFVPEKSPLPTRALLGQLRSALRPWSTP